MKSISMCQVGGVALGLLLAAGWAAAQQAPSAAGAGALKIGVVDMERLLSETTAGKQQAARANAVSEELRAEGEKRQAELGKLDQRLQQQQEQFEKEQASLSAEVRAQRQQALSKLTRERESYRQDSEDVLAAIQRRLQREQQRAEGELQERQDRLTALVQAVSGERGLDLVLDRRACVTISPTIDLTSEVLRRAEAQAPAAPAGRPAAKTPSAGAPPKK